MALASALVVLGVILVMGVAVATMGTGNLSVAYQQSNGERAYQVAEAGIHYAVLEIGNGTVSGYKEKTYRVPQSETRDDARVQFFVNKTGSAATFEGCPVEVPPGLIYVLSTGRAKSDGRNVIAQKKVGALISEEPGPTGGYGIYARDVKILGPGELAALASDGTVSTSENVVATNSLVPGSIEVVDANVEGYAVVPPGAPDQVLVGSVSKGLVRKASPLNFPKVDVPAPPRQADATVSAGLVIPGHYRNLTIAGNAFVNGTYVVSNLTIKPDARLELGETRGGAVELYVLDKLSLPANQVVFKNPKGSNRMRLFFLNEQVLEMRLDTDSAVTITAPKTDLTLKVVAGRPKGAVAARHVTLQLAAGTKYLLDLAAKLTPYEDTAADRDQGSTNRDRPPPPENELDMNSPTVLGRQRF